MKLCNVALYSPETSSGVRTYIENKMRYVSARPQPMEYVLLVAGVGPEWKKIKRYGVEHSGVKYLGQICGNRLLLGEGADALF